MNLDMQGIAISVGSACSSGSVNPSHVLTAMGFNTSRINGSVRFSLGRFTTRRQIEQTITTIVTLYQDRLKGAS
jgi:cysteine desulfurase